MWDAEEEDEDEGDFDPNEVDFFSPGPETEPEEPPVEEEDFSVSELMCMCSAELVTICQVTEQQKVEFDRAVSSTLLF